MKNFAKYAALTLIVVSFTTSCSLFRKKTTTDESAGVRTETTADGGSESFENSPMNFSAQGSDSGTIAGLSTVFFEYDKSTLTESENVKLQENVAWMKKNPGVMMNIEGHCDQRGSNEYNLSLGERRANSVKKMMVSMGIPANRLTIVSFGEEKPLVQGDSEEAMAKNRRANFVPSK